MRLFDLYTDPGQVTPKIQDPDDEMKMMKRIVQFMRDQYALAECIADFIKTNFNQKSISS